MTAVLHVGPDASGPAVGGMAAVIRTLVDTAPYPASAVPSWWPEGFRGRAGTLARSAFAVWRAPRGSVVHAHLSEGGSWVREGAFALLARMSGKTVALTLHGALFGEWTAGRAARAWARGVLRLAGVVFVLHDGDAARVRSLREVPVVVVANPVEAAGEGRPVGNGAAELLFLGLQSRRKGIDVLAEAWPRIRERCPAARLVVAGPPGDGDPPTGPGVVLSGAVDPERARQLLREAAVVALPSRAEALPMVLLEAMAEGVPFVAADVAGIPRLAETGAGLLVRPGDAESLAEAVVRLLADPGLRRAAGVAGQAWWREHATPAAVHETLSAGYRLAAGSEWAGRPCAGRGQSLRRPSAR